MPSPTAIYTAEDCKAAYQLDWGLSLSWKTPPENDRWLGDLESAIEQDDMRCRVPERCRITFI